MHFVWHDFSAGIYSFSVRLDFLLYVLLNVLSEARRFSVSACFQDGFKHLWCCGGWNGLLCWWRLRLWAESVLIDEAESGENLTLGHPTLNWPHGEGGEGLAHIDWKSIYFMIPDAYWMPAARLWLLHYWMWCCICLVSNIHDVWRQKTLNCFVVFFNYHHVKQVIQKSYN